MRNRLLLGRTVIFLLLVSRIFSAYGFHYYDDFEDEDCEMMPSHWLTSAPSEQFWAAGCEDGNHYYGQGQLSDSVRYSYLHVFERNPVFTGRFRVAQTQDGYLAFLIRYNAVGSYVKLRYHFARRRYELVEQEDANLLPTIRAAQTDSLSHGWHTFRVVAQDSSVEFWVDDVLKLTSSGIAHRTFDRVGLETYRTVAHFDNIMYRGKYGRVNAGVYERTLTMVDPSGRNLAQHLTIETLPDGSLLGLLATADEQVARTDQMLPLRLIRSFDQGLTWQGTEPRHYNYLLAEEDTIKHCCPQLLRLQSGKLLSLGLTSDGRGQFINSLDSGRHWQKAGSIPNLNRHAIMPDKLTQMTDGAIYGSLQRTLYVSHDEGGHWTPTDSFPLYDAPSRYKSVQEMQLIELPDSTLQIYARDGREGARTLAKSAAKIGQGNPLRDEMNNTPFVSPKNGFNVQRDPYHPNHYYIFWTYNDRRDEPAVNNLPRTRLALAMSYDGAKSWQYAMDVEEWGYPSAGYQYKDNRYANLALHVGPQYLYLTTKRRNPIGREKHADTQVWLTRVDKGKIDPYKSFPGTHY